MAQWRKGRKDNAIPLAEFQKLRLWQNGCDSTWITAGLILADSWMGSSPHSR